MNKQDTYPRASTFKVLSNVEWEQFEKLIPKRKSMLQRIVDYIKEFYLK